MFPRHNTNYPRHERQEKINNIPRHHTNKNTNENENEWDFYDPGVIYQSKENTNSRTRSNSNPITDKSQNAFNRNLKNKTPFVNDAAEPAYSFLDENEYIEMNYPRSLVYNSDFHRNTHLNLISRDDYQPEISNFNGSMKPQQSKQQQQGQKRNYTNLPRYYTERGEIHPGYRWTPIPDPTLMPKWMDWGELNSDNPWPMFSRTGETGDRILYQ